MGDLVSYLFVGLVVVAWVYAGYRIVRVSDRKHATLRYVSPFLALALALIAIALWPQGADPGAAEAPDLFILWWVVPGLVVLLGGALVIDRGRGRGSESS